MYRILLADDEGIAIDSLTFIIDKTWSGACELCSAKTAAP
jgi:YesN/AraC family two-component response regulator